MKREPPWKKHYRWHPYRSWLRWRNCEKCDQQFRRETGMRKREPYWGVFGPDYKHIYLCADCAGDS